MKTLLLASTFLLALGCTAPPASVSGDAAQVHSKGPGHGWLSWRGPHQNGSSDETGLVDRIEVGGKNHLWSYKLRGRGTPVVANGRVYFLGYQGEGKDLQEHLVCLTEDTGEKIWERRWNDFLTDVIYDRYAIGSPTVDPVTGDIYALSTAAVLMAFSPEGEPLWERAMASEYGRLTFPNGRTGAPLVDGDLVIIHVISSSWGPQGPARDRFFAFDKSTGECVWSTTPGDLPKDSSFSYPVVHEVGGRRVLYAGTGCGRLAAIDVRTGQTLWTYLMAVGGVNSSALVHDDEVIAIHGKENIDTSTLGRMVRLKTGAVPAPGAKGPVEFGAGDELWRADLVAFTSSPVLVGDRIYQTVATGELYCVNAETGAVLWHERLAPDQIHASPVAADGKLYVPMNNGSFYVIKPSDSGPEILCEVQLAGNCLGAPAIANGRIYVHTTEMLYCFGDGKSKAPVWTTVPEAGGVGEPAMLQFVPGDAIVREGSEIPFRVRVLDAAGKVVQDPQTEHVTFGYMQPPIVTRTEAGHWRGERPGAGDVKATHGNLSGSARVRVVPKLPYTLDFEATELNMKGEAPWAFPPAHWLAAKPKWKVIEKDGGKVLARNIENPLFQRTLSMVGHPEDRNYTTQVDLYSDGNRRTMCDPGFVNQRYLIRLRGNYQELEISSNDERVKEAVPYKWKHGLWYTMKARVDLAEDGRGVIRAKVWPRDEAEPEAWTLEVEHENAHEKGAAGLYGFTPQSRFTLYMDNFSVTPNE